VQSTETINLKKNYPLKIKINQFNELIGKVQSTKSLKQKHKTFYVGAEHRNNQFKKKLPIKNKVQSIQ
jgi:hypothetical protein